MQHRHFVKIAQTIAGLDVTAEQRASIADQFADSLRTTNLQFNRSRFVACALGTPSNGRDR